MFSKEELNDFIDDELKNSVEREYCEEYLDFIRLVKENDEKILQLIRSEYFRLLPTNEEIFEQIFSNWEKISGKN